MVAAQQECAETQEAAASTSLRIEFFHVNGKNLMCDVSLARPRPVVPVSLREAVFASIHSIAHPGIRATKRMVSARFCGKGWERT
jgi:cleavage and polyadenylation specificity factor subunit 1